MISLSEHHLALNSFDAPGYEFSMSVTWKMPRSATVYDVVYWIGYACDRAPLQHLRHVVINSHGCDGHVFIGQDRAGQAVTINSSNVHAFSALRTKDIGTVWLLGCELAKTTFGQRFLSQLAVTIGCDVVAADVVQEGWNGFWGSLFMPSGNIDDFEGKVYRFSPSGSYVQLFPNGGTY